MNDDDLLKHSLFKKNPLHGLQENPLHDILEREKLWKEITKKDTRLSDITKNNAYDIAKDNAYMDDAINKVLNDFSEKESYYEIKSYLNNLTDPRENLELLNKSINQIKAEEKIERNEKESEELRRHEEKITLLKIHASYLEELLKDSRNAVEQRNAIIHFIVKYTLDSNQPKEIKRDFLMNLMVPVATVSSGAGDLMQLIKEALELIR